MNEDEEIEDILAVLAEFHEDAFPIYDEILDLFEGENSAAALVALSMATSNVLAEYISSRESADLVAKAIAKSVLFTLDHFEKNNFCAWQEGGEQ